MRNTLSGLMRASLGRTYLFLKIMRNLPLTKLNQILSLSSSTMMMKKKRLSLQRMLSLMRV